MIEKCKQNTKVIAFVKSSWKPLYIYEYNIIILCILIYIYIYQHKSSWLFDDNFALLFIPWPESDSCTIAPKIRRRRTAAV